MFLYFVKLIPNNSEQSHFFLPKSFFAFSKSLIFIVPRSVLRTTPLVGLTLGIAFEILQLRR